MDLKIEAVDIEDKITAIREKHPITIENGTFWLVFCKDIKFKIEEIEDSAKNIIDKETERQAKWIK